MILILPAENGMLKGLQNKWALSPILKLFCLTFEAVMAVVCVVARGTAFRLFQYWRVAVRREFNEIIFDGSPDKKQNKKQRNLWTGKGDVSVEKEFYGTGFLLKSGVFWSWIV